MTLTLLELYNECAGQPWSMFDNDAETEEDLESSLKISINKAISFLWNYQPWSFRIEAQTIKTKAGNAKYTVPEGNLLKKTIRGEQKYGIKYGKKYLSYAQDYDLLDETETGEPEQFYIEGENLYIYPTPDEAYSINLKYLLLPYGLNEKEDNVYELTSDTDYINIPEKYETLFKNCLISLAMMYAIADETDENYSGYSKQYEDALAILLKYCKNGVVNRDIVW